MIFAAAACWGTSATLARHVFRDRGVPALEVVEIRLAVAVACLFAWLGLTRRAALRIHRRDWGYFLALGLFGVASVQGSYYWGISKLGVGLAILLQYLAPSIIVIGSMAIRRKVKPWNAVAAVGALAGIALLIGGIDPKATGAGPLSWLVGISSAFFFAFYIVFSKRGLERYAPETVLLYGFAIAWAFWAILIPPWRIISAGYGASLWGMFLVLGIFSTLVPFTLFNRGLKKLAAAEAGVIASSEPVVATLSAWAFLGEALGGRQWLGAVLVLASAIATTLDRGTVTTARAAPERSGT